MKTSALTKAGIDRLHRAMALRVENGSLPGMVTLVAQGDDVAIASGEVAIDGLPGLVRAFPKWMAWSNFAPTMRSRFTSAVSYTKSSRPRPRARALALNR